MVYKHNVHILLPIEQFEQLRLLGAKLQKPRAELAREAIFGLLKKAQRRGEIPSDISVPAC